MGLTSKEIVEKREQYKQNNQYKGKALTADAEEMKNMFIYLLQKYNNQQVDKLLIRQSEEVR